MYVIINDHWDGSWWGMFGSASEETRVKAMDLYKTMWHQIARHFADYSYKLVFESANEELGDRLNAMLSAAGFNLVKLMKGLKRRWLKRLFLCLRTVAGDIVGIVAGILRWIDAAWRQAATASCRPSFAANWLFA